MGLVALAAAGAVFLGIVFISSSEEADKEISIVQPKTTAEAGFSPSPTAEPTAPPVLEAVIHGFRFPLEGACLPQGDDLMPNAPREYRSGIHQGVDFYDGRCCVAVARGMPVMAVKTGVVIRADHDYQDITAEEMESLLTLTEERGYTDSATLDRLRGRQVWVDHGQGIVTRYAHLSAIAVGVREDVVVEAGEVLGYVGNSGTPEGISDVSLENHLHFEIRVGRTYLGEGLSPAETRRLWERAFSP